MMMGWAQYNALLKRMSNLSSLELLLAEQTVW